MHRFLVLPSLLLTLGFVVCAATTGRAAPAQGSASRGVVAGVVRDESGAPLTAATVDATVAGEPIASTVTGSDGRYELAVAPGAGLQLRVRMPGFADAILTAAGPSLDVVLRVAAPGDSVIVTAARLPERRATTSASTTVLTASDIEGMGQSSLADLVRSVPGVAVEVNGREGGLASLFTRGGESDYNLVLIDGVRVNQSGGSFDFSRVPAAEIDRLEVVRGAQSALYGSDAIGSVVQVFTRRASPADAPLLEGSIEGGSFDTWRGHARVFGGAARRFDYQAGVTGRHTDGAFQDVLPEHDRFDETTVDVGGGATLGATASLRSGFRYATGDGKAVGPINYGSRDTGTAANNRDLSWHVDVAHRAGARLNGRASFAFYRSSRLSADTIADPSYNVYTVLTGTPGAIFPDGPRLVRLVDQATFNALRNGTQPLAAGEFLASTRFPVGDFPFSSTTEFRRSAFKYQADAAWAGGQMLSGGYEYEHEDDPLTPSFLVTNHALFVQNQSAFADRWFVTIGARVDGNSRFGNTASPKVGVAAMLLEDRSALFSSAKVFLNAGRGIKNPTFGELYGSAFTDGNPDLRPERARTFDAGIEMTFASQRAFARVAGFDSAYDDQVAFKSSGPGVDGRPDFINIDGSKARGWELEGGVQRPVAGGLTALAGYTFVDSEVVSSVNTNEEFQPGQPLLRRPRHAMTVRAAYSRGRGSIGVHLRHVGERHDAAFLGLATPPTPQFPAGRSVDITVNPAYTLVWLTGEVRVSPRASAFASVDNLGNTQYEHALGYPALPRSFVAGIRLNTRLPR